MTDFDLNNLDAEGWLDVLPTFQQTIVAELLKSGRTEEQIAELWLNRIGPEANAGFGAAGSLITYLSNFRSELDAFICGDERYAQERAEATSIWEKQGKSSLVALVAGCIATKVGLAAVALVPVVALFFALIGRMGVGAYCKTRVKV